MIADLLFFMFASILVVSALGVISAKNPMYCVLFMILAFVNAAGLFLTMGAEFLGLLLIMVYVGAIAVMFLFVVMTIDIDFASIKEGMATYLPVGLLCSAVFFIEICASIIGSHIGKKEVLTFSGLSDLGFLGQVLFTDYQAPFLIVSLVLLVAMVGSILLAHRERPKVKRQDISSQIARKLTDSVLKTKPTIGQGATAQYYNPKTVEK